jgi:O-antigen/teichoic acid export membrane protein
MQLTFRRSTLSLPPHASLLCMSSLRRVVSGAAWGYGAQAATILLQLGYTAITSRLLTPDVFGVYAVAILVAGFVTLIGNGGLSYAVTRMRVIERQRLVNLTFYGLLLGSGAGVFLVLTSALWASLWGTPEASSAIQLMGIAAFMAPLTALTAGLLRREGRFKSLAIGTLASNTIGMLLGIAAAHRWGTAASLLVYVLTSQALLLIVGQIFTKGLLLGRPRFNRERSDLHFSFRLTASNILSYLILNLGPWAIARALPSSILGHWNRAETVSTIPFYQVQTALIQAVSPEFRHDIEHSGRAHKVWTDLLSLASWVALPACAILAVLVPQLTVLILGDKWVLAGQLASVFALVGGIKLLTGLLSSGLEVLGRFKWVWITQLLLLAVQAPVLFATFALHSPWPVVFGLLGTNLIQHVLNIVLAARWGYLHVPRLLAQYSGALITSLSIALTLWWLIGAIGRAAVVEYTAAGSILACATILATVFWRRLPPVKLVFIYLHRDK